MERLTGKDLRRISDFLRDLYQLRTHEEFTTHLVAAIPSITEGEFTTYNEFHLNGKEGIVKSDQIPHISNPGHYAGIINRYADQHPFLIYLQRTKDGRAKMLSDFLSVREFRQTPLYQEFYKPLQIPYLAVMSLAGNRHTSITISRHRSGREFNEKTRTILNAIRPHLSQAFKNAMAITKTTHTIWNDFPGDEGAHTPVLAVTPTGRIKWATPLAYRLIRQYCLQNGVGMDRLAPNLCEWLIYQQKQLDSPKEIATPVSLLNITHGDRKLSLRLIRNGCQSLLFLEEQRSVIDNKRLYTLGLSKRETEILGWVTEGKTNPEIGTILSISPRTVQKHLERVYGHLGVENRHAAMRVAWDAIRRNGVGSGYD
jgi:DNA-binding CsgD family transcriptional regulator